jgi:anthranilate phosphoribosyltransferase
MIVDALRSLTKKQDLSQEDAAAVVTELIEGNATPAQIGGILAALRTKGESAEELAGFASVMRERAVRVSPRKRPLIDTCGTGADQCDTFNISTAAAFVVAASGIAVAKHGNRAVSSQCGSADVLAALGVHTNLAPEHIAECIDTVGLGFMFAPAHHPATANVSQPRRELGIPTIFNIVGPLTNPAGASRQLVGVFDPDLCPKVAEVLGILGCERAMVVHGMHGLDEISTVGATRISQLQHGRVSTETRIPAEFFVVPAEIEQLAGGDTPEENAEILRSVLHGESGPRRDIVSVNAAAGMILGGMADSWRDGISLAHRMIDSGRAAQVLNRLIEYTAAHARTD